MKPMKNNPFWMDSAVVEDKDYGEKNPDLLNWFKTISNFRYKDWSRLTTAALAKFTTIHGSRPSIQDQPHFSNSEVWDDFTLTDWEGASPLERKRFGDDEEYLHGIFEEATPEWGGGWGHFMDSFETRERMGPKVEQGRSRTRGAYRMAIAHGYTLSRDRSGCKSVPIESVHWLKMDENPHLMQDLHRSVGVMNNILTSELNGFSMCREIRGSAEFGALLLYVFGDDMTEYERMMTMTVAMLTSLAPKLMKISNSQVPTTVNSRSIDTWLEAITYLAPLASDPRAYMGLESNWRLNKDRNARREENAFKSRGIAAKLDRASLASVFISALLVKKNATDSRSFRKTSFVNGNDLIFSTFHSMFDWDEPLGEGFNYTDDVLDLMDLPTQSEFAGATISAQGAVRWAQQGFTDPSVIVKYVGLGITDPVQAKSVDSTPDS